MSMLQQPANLRPASPNQPQASSAPSRGSLTPEPIGPCGLRSGTGADLWSALSRIKLIPQPCVGGCTPGKPRLAMIARLSAHSSRSVLNRMRWWHRGGLPWLVEVAAQAAQAEARQRDQSQRQPDSPHFAGTDYSYQW